MSTTSSLRRQLDPLAVATAERTAPAIYKRELERKVGRNVRRGVESSMRGMAALLGAEINGKALEREVNQLTKLALKRQASVKTKPPMKVEEVLPRRSKSRRLRRRVVRSRMAKASRRRNRG